MKYNLSHRYIRASANLEKLERAAKQLEELNDQVVYLGGCVVGLFITDPAALDVRPTVDVDCIIDIISRSNHGKFEEALRKKGFIGGDIICRWHYGEDIMLDVMPADRKILGFSNIWYKDALQYAVSHQIAVDLHIRSVSAPYFLAIKIEAFKSRGNNDFRASQDFEDIITVIAGRAEIVEEVMSSAIKLRVYLRQFFEDMFTNPEFESALPEHLNEGSITEQRVQMVTTRIMHMIAVEGA